MFPTHAKLGMTPLEKYTGIKLDFSHLTIFGFVVHVHVDKENKKQT
jgi:hypothetical protein